MSEFDADDILYFTYHEEDRAEYPYVFDIKSRNYMAGETIIVALMQLRSVFREMFQPEEQDKLDDPWDNRRYLFGAGQIAFRDKKDAALFRMLI